MVIHRFEFRLPPHPKEKVSYKGGLMIKITWVTKTIKKKKKQLEWAFGPKYNLSKKCLKKNMDRRMRTTDIKTKSII